MGEIRTFEPGSSLPAPTKFDLLGRSYANSRSVFRDAEQAASGNLADKRAWLKRCDDLLQRAPHICGELDAVSRPGNRGEIADALKALRLNCHSSGKGATAETNRLMAERVGAHQPSIGALNMAVLTMIDGRTYFPVTAEVLSEIAEAERQLSMTREFLGLLPRERDRIAAMIAASEQRETERLARQREGRPWG